ncbi:MAG: Xaa-Pro peptidase family protein [Actinobacteria bacterium]|nr:Xaa-Pro peptidase family protein [Actinomycetota bacterium]MCL6104168.1 Xaa-Pro peptidase family protein [Actinomycetota bacterium]
MSSITELSALPSIDTGSRIERLRDKLSEAGYDAILITSLTNIRYLTGFSGSAAMLLLSAENSGVDSIGGNIFCTDGRYKLQASQELESHGVGGIEIVVGGIAEQMDALLKCAPKKPKKVALEASQVSWEQQRRFAKRFSGCKLVPSQDIVAQLRIVKDQSEIEHMRLAAQIADTALADIKKLLIDTAEKGISEIDLAIELDFSMRRGGSQMTAFDTIVASGENAAKPHARPTKRIIRPAELVIIDFGAVVDGYRSDMTRTLCLGEPNTKMAKKVLEIVSMSQLAGLAAIAAGEAASTIDAACRDIIDQAGWGENFLHGTGHGVGLDIHEQPFIGKTSKDILQEGSVVTVEPGVYLDSTDDGSDIAGSDTDGIYSCGARIEDMVVVTKKGYISLTSAPRDVLL